MENIEGYIWLLCLDQPDIKITRVSNFVEWIFAIGYYISQKVFTNVHLMSSFECGHFNRNHEL